MEIAFTIPSWVLWTVGIVGGVVILFLAALGVVFVRFMSTFRINW